jgi:hypothetical protein
MYNLLVSADEEAWKYPDYEYDKTRVFEFTPEYFIKEFNFFSNNIDKLTKIPSLFIHEMFEGKSKVGYIKKIKQNHGKYHITLDFVCDISSEKLSYLESELGFIGYEISRTHWAVKDVDLISVLLENKILIEEHSLFFRTPTSLPKIKFDIAFSFPGEKRELISKIVNILKEKRIYSIFYDRDFVEQLAMPDMDLLLMNIYKKQSRLICILLSKEYQNKKWCQLEWKAVREIIQERKDAIMFLKYDDSDIPGVSSNDGYIDINQYTLEQISAFIQNRLRTIYSGDNNGK